MPGRIEMAAAVALACIASGAAHADAVQDQVLAAARATPTDRHRFHRTITIDRTGAARKVLVEQFDPRRAVADRWSLVSTDGHAPTPKEAADLRKTKHGPTPSYAELAKWFGAPATRSDSAPGYALYRFARLPAGTLKIGSHDASADTQAEALVNLKGQVPFVERVRLTSTKGFRMMLVASVERIVIDQRYRLLGDGGAVPGDAASEFAGSMLGKAGSMRTSVSYADFQPVR